MFGHARLLRQVAWQVGSSPSSGKLTVVSGNTDISTTSATFVDVTGVTVTVTTSGGSDVLVLVSIPMKLSANIGYATITRDGVDGAVMATTQSTTDQTLTFFTVYTAETAGSHTYKARYRNANGVATVSVNMSSAQNGAIVVLEIGGAKR